MKRRIRFTFAPDLVKEPVVYRLGRDFDLVTNILQADVTVETGWVDLELEGNPAEIDRGLAWVASRGVQVAPLSEG